MPILFSLILPVYNVELYIEKCLRSCLEQLDISPLEYEIILVDDGSQDHSIEIVMKVIKEYPNHQVRIIHRENGGLSAARNTGMKEAKGKYLWFIDSDDWIENNSLLSLKNKLKEITNVNILSFLHRTIYTDGSLSPMIYQLDYLDDGFKFLSENYFLSAWSRIYNRDFLLKEKLLFCEGYVWEDAELNLRAFCLCKCHYFFASAYLYYYRRRKKSITTGGITDLMERSRFNVIDTVIAFLSQRELCDKQIKIINLQLSKILIAAIVGIGELPKELSTKYYLMYKSKKDIYLRLLSNTDDNLSKLLSFMLRVNFSLTCFLLKKKMDRATKK